jgi:cytochrome c oxidase assembly protein subunit 15
MSGMGSAPGWVVKLALVAVLTVCSVIILGSWTRLADAGLGCPDWPGCYGQLIVPQTAEEIQLAESLYPDSPVEVGKGWLEMIHRYLATILGFFILVIALGSWFYRRRLYYPFKHSQLLLAVVLMQGAFGAWTVTWKLWPQIVTAHLFGGFITASLLSILMLRLSRMGRQVRPLRLQHRRGSLRFWALIGLLLTSVQIFLGGWMSANYAALACSDLPACNGQWWPAMNFAEGFNLSQTIGPNYLGGLMDGEGRKAIHVIHRFMAVVLGIYLILMARKLWQQPDARLHFFAGLIMVLFAIQFLLGLANVYWHLPLPVAVAHNFGGACLFVTMMCLNYFLFSSRSRVSYE